MSLVHFDKIEVSEIKIDFTKTAVEDVPREFLEDWVGLICKVVRLFYPNFALPLLPRAVDFSRKTHRFCEYTGDFPDMVHPDISDFVWLEKEVYYFEIKNADWRGVEIRHHSESAIEGVKFRARLDVNLIGFPSLKGDTSLLSLTSYIYLDSPDGGAFFTVTAPDREMWEITRILRKY
ncbi:MAG TPA: hypothetical protein VF599_20815 [Pyrinomonadaceae bacterium]|jgi:hypothetical protein